MEEKPRGEKQKYATKKKGNAMRLPPPHQLLTNDNRTSAGQGNYLTAD